MVSCARCPRLSLLCLVVVVLLLLLLLLLPLLLLPLLLPLLLLPFLFLLPLLLLSLLQQVVLLSPYPMPSRLAQLLLPGLRALACPSSSCNTGNEREQQSKREEMHLYPAPAAAASNGLFALLLSVHSRSLASPRAVRRFVSHFVPQRRDWHGLGLLSPAARGRQPG